MGSAKNAMLRYRNEKARKVAQRNKDIIIMVLEESIALRRSWD